MANTFDQSKMVWAKFSRFPWWPAFLTGNRTESEFEVQFFGTFDIALLRNELIRPFHDTPAFDKKDQINKKLQASIVSAHNVLKGRSCIEEEIERLATRQPNKMLINSKPSTPKKLPVIDVLPPTKPSFSTLCVLPKLRLNTSGTFNIDFSKIVSPKVRYSDADHGAEDQNRSKKRILKAKKIYSPKKSKASVCALQESISANSKSTLCSITDLLSAESCKNSSVAKAEARCLNAPEQRAHSRPHNAMFVDIQPFRVCKETELLNSCVAQLQSVVDEVKFHNNITLADVQRVQVIVGRVLDNHLLGRANQSNLGPVLLDLLAYVRAHQVTDSAKLALPLLLALLQRVSLALLNEFFAKSGQSLQAADVSCLSGLFQSRTDVPSEPQERPESGAFRALEKPNQTSSKREGQRATLLVKEDMRRRVFKKILKIISQSSNRRIGKGSCAKIAVLTHDFIMRHTPSLAAYKQCVVNFVNKREEFLCFFNNLADPELLHNETRVSEQLFKILIK